MAEVDSKASAIAVFDGLRSWLDVPLNAEVGKALGIGGIARPQVPQRTTTSLAVSVAALCVCCSCLGSVILE